MPDKENKLTAIIDEIDDGISEIVDDAEVDKSKSQKKQIVIFLIVFVIFVLVAIISSVIYMVSREFNDAELDQIQSPQELAQPAKIANFSPAPILQLDKLEGLESRDEIEPIGLEAAPLIQEQTKNQEYLVATSEFDIKSIDQKLDQLSNHITQLSNKVTLIEHDLASNKSQNKSVHLSIDKVKSQVNRLGRELNQLSKTKHKASTTIKSKQSPPPTPISTAIWNGRDALMIESPAGKIKLIYVSDIVGDWRVVRLNSNSVTYKSLIDQQTRTLKIGE